MLIALNRRNRDQHNETDNQRTLLGLPSRFHIIMSPMQPCGPRHTVAHRPHVPMWLGECIRSGYTSLRHVAAFFVLLVNEKIVAAPRPRSRDVCTHRALRLTSYINVNAPLVPANSTDEEKKRDIKKKQLNVGERGKITNLRMSVFRGKMGMRRRRRGRTSCNGVKIDGQTNRGEVLKSGRKRERKV